MANNFEAINAAIIAFGGDKDPAWCYWIRKEEDASIAWFVGMSYGVVANSIKTNAIGVRAVAPVP